jgi:hypothetical protein
VVSVKNLVLSVFFKIVVLFPTNTTEDKHPRTIAKANLISRSNFAVDIRFDWLLVDGGAVCGG